MGRQNERMGPEDVANVLKVASGENGIPIPEHTRIQAGGTVEIADNPITIEFWFFRGQFYIRINGNQHQHFCTGGLEWELVDQTNTVVDRSHTNPGGAGEFLVEPAAIVEHQHSLRFTGNVVVDEQLERARTALAQMTIRQDNEAADEDVSLTQAIARLIVDLNISLDAVPEEQREALKPFFRRGNYNLVFGFILQRRLPDVPDRDDQSVARLLAEFFVAMEQFNVTWERPVEGRGMIRCASERCRQFSIATQSLPQYGRLVFIDLRELIEIGEIENDIGFADYGEELEEAKHYLNEETYAELVYDLGQALLDREHNFNYAADSLYQITGIAMPAEQIRSWADRSWELEIEDGYQE